MFRIVPVHTVKHSVCGGGLEIELHSFLTSEPDRDKCSAIRSGRFTSDPLPVV